MLILKKITLKNFLSHGNTEIKFKDNQKLLIDGKSGSGKSSIVEAIVWCLYGKGRGDNKSLIKNGKNGAKVVLELQDNDTGYLCTVERSITKTNKHSLDVTEGNDVTKMSPIKTTGVKGAQEYLEKNILKSSYLLFINSIVYLQENIDTFVKQTAAKRKEIILEIINSNNYDEYLKKSKELIQDTKLNVGINESKLADKEKQMVNDEARADNLEIYKEQKTKIYSESISNDELLRKVQDEYDTLSEKLIYISSKEAVVSDLTDRINQADREITTINGKIISLELVDAKKLEDDAKEYDRLKAELSMEEGRKEKALVWQEAYNKIMAVAPVDHDFNLDIESINKKIINIFNEKVPECPKCNTKYPEFENDKQSRIGDLESELSLIKIRQSEYIKNKDAHLTAIDNIGARPEYDASKIAELVSNINKYSGAKEKLMELAGKAGVVKQLSENIDNLTNEKNSLIKKKSDLLGEISDKKKIENDKMSISIRRQELLAKKQSLISQNLENESLLTLAEDAYNNIVRNKEDIKNIKNELNKLTENLTSLLLIKEAFGPNGVKAIVIDYVIPQLEDKINDVLSRISDFRIMLETQKSGSKEETVLEGLFITIVNELGDMFDYSSYSGGEKLKITVAISEALAEIQKLGFRVLDELFVGLDEESTESFTSVMMELQDRFSQMICISHIRDIKDIFDEKLLVSKNNGTSSIKS